MPGFQELSGGNGPGMVVVGPSGGTNDGAVINAAILAASPLGAPVRLVIVYQPGVYNFTTDAIRVQSNHSHMSLGGSSCTTMFAFLMSCMGIFMLDDGNVHAYNIQGFAFEGAFGAGVDNTQTIPGLGNGCWLDHRSGTSTTFTGTSGDVPAGAPATGFQSTNFSGRASLPNNPTTVTPTGTASDSHTVTSTGHGITPTGVSAPINPCIFSAKGASQTGITLNTVTYWVRATDANTLTYYTDSAGVTLLTFTVPTGAAAASVTTKVGQTKFGTGTSSTWNGTDYIQSLRSTGSTGESLLDDLIFNNWTKGAYQVATPGDTKYMRWALRMASDQGGSINTSGLNPAGNGYMLSRITSQNQSDQNGIDIFGTADGSIDQIHLGMPSNIWLTPSGTVGCFGGSQGASSIPAGYVTGGWALYLNGSNWRVNDWKVYFAPAGGVCDRAGGNNIGGGCSQDNAGPGLMTLGADTNIYGYQADTNAIGWTNTALRVTCCGGLNFRNRLGGGWGVATITQYIGVSWNSGTVRSGQQVQVNATDPQATTLTVSSVSSTNVVTFSQSPTVITNAYVGSFVPVLVTAAAGNFNPSTFLQNTYFLKILSTTTGSLYLSDLATIVALTTGAGTGMMNMGQTQGMIGAGTAASYDYAGGGFNIPTGDIVVLDNAGKHQISP